MLKITLTIEKKLYGNSDMEVLVKGESVELSELQAFEKHLYSNIYGHLFNFVICHKDMHSSELKNAIKTH